MSDELVPLPPQIQGMPSPRDVGTMLIANLAVRVHHARTARGDVHQPEDVYPLVRSLAGAKEMLEDYARAFTTAAAEAKYNLDDELVAAVGEQAGIPTSGLTVPDVDGTDIHLTLATPNSHDIGMDAVLNVVVADVLARARDSEPDNLPGEDFYAYRDRYETWMAGVMRMAIDQVIELGSYSMQVSKVRAYETALAGDAADDLAGVVRGSITKTSHYRGIKLERKERKKR